MKLVCNIATRGRPQWLVETVEETLSKSRKSPTIVMVSADEDDIETIEVLQKLRSDPCLKVSIKPREPTVAAKWNRAFTETDADVILAMCDYAPPVEVGFDRLILDAAASYADGYTVLVGPMANACFTRGQAVTRKLADRMNGKMYPEFFPFWFSDHWLDDIGTMIGRRVFMGCDFDTSRRRSGSHSTLELREIGFWASLYDSLALAREVVALEILMAPDFIVSQEQRQALIKSFPLTEQRGWWISEQIRRDPNQGDLAPDERYFLIRREAEVLMQRMQGYSKAA